MYLQSGRLAPSNSKATIYSSMYWGEWSLISAHVGEAYTSTPDTRVVICDKYFIDFISQEKYAALGDIIHKLSVTFFDKRKIEIYGISR